MVSKANTERAQLQSMLLRQCLHRSWKPTNTVGEISDSSWLFLYAGAIKHVHRKPMGIYLAHCFFLFFLCVKWKCAPSASSCLFFYDPCYGTRRDEYFFVLYTFGCRRARKSVRSINSVVETRGTLWNAWAKGWQLWTLFADDCRVGARLVDASWLRAFASL